MIINANEEQKDDRRPKKESINLIFGRGTQNRSVFNVDLFTDLILKRQGRYHDQLSV